MQKSWLCYSLVTETWKTTCSLGQQNPPGGDTSPSLYVHRRGRNFWREMSEYWTTWKAGKSLGEGMGKKWHTVIDLKSCGDRRYVIDSGGGGCVLTHMFIYMCVGCVCTHRGLRSTMVYSSGWPTWVLFSINVLIIFPMIVLLFENFIPVYNAFGHIHLPIPPPAYHPFNSMSLSFYFYSPLSPVRASYTCMDVGASMGVWATNGHRQKERWLFLPQQPVGSLSQLSLSGTWLGHQAPEIRLSLSLLHKVTSGFSMGGGESNSGPHTHAASTLAIDFPSSIAIGFTS